VNRLYCLFFVAIVNISGDLKGLCNSLAIENK
jgi:hypothetical protein